MDSANQQYWTEGINTYGNIMWNHYMYNCTNVDQVSFIQADLFAGNLQKRASDVYGVWTLLVS